MKNKPFDVGWPPALLLREDIVLAFVPYKNPKLATARSIEDLVGEPLGIAYFRNTDTWAKLTKADAARVIEVKLVREERDYLLIAANLKNPSDTLRFRVGQVEYHVRAASAPSVELGIEDRPDGPPVLHLQVGPLILRGIERR